MKKTIGIYDSGIGGVSVLNEMLKNNFNVRYIYLADIKNVPYGEKTEEDLKKIVDENLKKLISKKVAIIIIACNTASYIYYKYLKDKIEYKESNVKIYLITEYSIKYINENNIKNVNVLETDVLEKNKAFRYLFEKYTKKTNTNILEKSGKNLASIIENRKEYEDSIEEVIRNIGEEDYLVLSCTHYALIEKDFLKIIKFQKKNIKLINPAKYLVEEFKEFIDVKNKKAKIDLLNTLNDKKYIDIFNTYILEEFKIEEKNIKITKEKKNKKNIFINILIVLLILFTIIVSTFFIYSSLNKESGIDNIFHLFTKKEMRSEEAVQISKKYIELLYNKKIEEYNINSRDNKYYFSSSIADVVLDKKNGSKYFDKISSNEKDNDEMPNIIYIYAKKVEKLNNKNELIIEETKPKMYVEKKILEDNLNEEKINNIKNTINQIEEKQIEIFRLLKDKNKTENESEKKHITHKVKDLNENINEIKKKFFLENEKKISLERILNKEVNKTFAFTEKENLEKNDEEKIYANKKNMNQALILGYSVNNEVIILKGKKIYLFQKIDIDEYFKLVSEKRKRIEENALKIKNKLFTYKDFEKYVISKELIDKDDKEIIVNFYKLDRNVIDKTSKIEMTFNKASEKLININVSLNNIPYSEVKINKYDATKIAYKFLNDRNLLDNTKIKGKEQKNLNYSDLVEYIKIELDHVNNYFDTEKQKNEVEKMWKIKFKNSSNIVYVDTYFGKIIGGEKVK